MEKYNFDSSKDQEKFNQLTKQEKDKILEDAHDEANLIKDKTKSTNGDYFEASKSVDSDIVLREKGVILQALTDKQKEDFLQMEKKYEQVMKQREGINEYTGEEYAQWIKEKEALEDSMGELMRGRFKQFAEGNKKIFSGVPSDLIETTLKVNSLGWSLEQLGHLLSLPYHVKKIKEDGITHLLLSAAASVPYGFILKELYRFMYPDEKQVEFLIYSTKVTKEGKEQQDKKFTEYFSKQPDAVIGTFDECAVSYEESYTNKRGTAAKIQEEIESLLNVVVKGRYGTETIFPEYRPENFKKDRMETLILKPSLRGDEGKGAGLFKGKTDWGRFRGKYGEISGDHGNIFTSKSVVADRFNAPIGSKGYARIKKGREGIDFINKLRGLAKIAFDNFTENPDSIWNPFEKRIRSMQEDTGGTYYADRYYRANRSSI